MPRRPFPLALRVWLSRSGEGERACCRTRSNGLEVLIQEHHAWVLRLRRLNFLGCGVETFGLTDPPLLTRIQEK